MTSYLFRTCHDCKLQADGSEQAIVAELVLVHTVLHKHGAPSFCRDSCLWDLKELPHKSGHSLQPARAQAAQATREHRKTNEKTR